MKDNSISVIIPVYNAEKNIKNCIQGLLSQTVPPNQIILINDGSNDNSLRIMEEFLPSPIIEIYNQRNEGVSKARNIGLSHINSKYVAFVDSDDLVKKDYLEILLHGYDYVNTDLSISGISYEDANGTKIYSDYKTGMYSSFEILRSLFYENGHKGYLWNKLWKTNIIKKFNLRLDETISMAEDLLFLVEYLQHSNKVYVSNQPTYVYKTTENSLSSQIRLEKFDNRFIKTNEDFLYVCTKVIDYLPKDDANILIDAYAFRGRTAANFLRQLRLYNKVENIDLQRKISKLCSKSKHDVNLTKTMSVKNKLGFFLTLYLPNVMLLLDKKRFKR